MEPEGFAQAGVGALKLVEYLPVEWRNAIRQLVQDNWGMSQR